MQKLMLAFLGLIWSAGFFLLGLNLTFPGDQLKDFLVYTVDSETRGDLLLDLAGTSPWRGTGVTLDEPRLYSIPKGRRGEEPVPELLLQADEVSVRALPGKLIGGDVGVAFDAELYGGDLSGTVVQEDGVSEVVADVEGLDLGRYPMDFDSGSINLAGTIQGVIDVVFDADDVKRSSGSIDFEFPGLALGEGSSAGGFDLPAMTFSKAVLSFDIDDGTAEVDEGVFLSDVLEAEFSGEVSLATPLKRSRLALDVELRLLDEKLSTLADLYGDMKRSKTDDGAYVGGIIGTFERPSWRWDRGASSGRTSTGRATTIRTPRDDFDPDVDPELRREDRQERIRERRDRLRDEQGGGTPVRPRSDDEEYDDEEYDDDEEYEDDEEYDDEEEYEDAEFERASTPRRLPGADMMGDRGPVGLPEPDYDDVPPPDFSNDIRPDGLD